MYKTTTELGAEVKVMEHNDKYCVTITSNDITGLMLAKHFQKFLSARNAVFHAIHKRSENKFDVIASLDISGLEQCDG